MKPQVYNWIHDSMHEVIHVDYKDLAMVFFSAGSGMSFWTGARGIGYLYVGQSGCDGTGSEIEVLWAA